MKARKGILFLTLLVGILSHAGSLYFLHGRSLTPGPLNFKKNIFSPSDYFQPEQELAEIFAYLTEPPTVELKQQLHELTPECTPKTFSPVIAEQFLIEPGAKLVFELPESEQGEDLIHWEKSPLHDEPTESISFSAIEPPKFDFIFDTENYDSFDGVIAESDHFTATVEYAPRRLRSGYVFKITFHPKSDIAFKRIRQNYFFLVDRSNSISRSRYFNNKKAVSSALSLLQPGDTFNILIFDNRVTRLADKPLPFAEETLVFAKDFLDKQGHGGHFAATDLYASLGKIIPHDVSEKELNTAILLSDGDTYLTLEKQRQIIGRWTIRNRGKVALFSLASGCGNNLPLLDLISTFNKGSLLYASTHEEVEDKLTRLITTVQNPIGKNMRATAISGDPQNLIQLQPKNMRSPELYQNRPFVVWGTTNRLTPFTLFLQGDYYDRRFDIKKKITFDTAQNGTLSMEREWTRLLAQ